MIIVFSSLKVLSYFYLYSIINFFKHHFFLLPTNKKAAAIFIKITTADFSCEHHVSFLQKSQQNYCSTYKRNNIKAGLLTRILKRLCFVFSVSQ